MDQTTNKRSEIWMMSVQEVTGCCGPWSHQGVMRVLRCEECEVSIINNTVTTTISPSRTNYTKLSPPRTNITLPAMLEIFHLYGN